MICLRSTTTRARPALIRLVSRSPNALAVLLSMRPLTSTIVISPVCCSEISITWSLLQLFSDSYYVMPSRPHVCYLIHQCLDEMDAQAADPSRSQGPAGRRRGGLPQIERFSVILDFGGQQPAGQLEVYDYTMRLPVLITVRNRVVQELVKAKVQVIGNDFRNVVSRAEPIDKIDDLLHLGNRVADHETGLVPGTGRLH